MPDVVFITHPEVVIDPAVPVPRWGLAPVGVARMRRLLEAPWTRRLGTVAASTEHKAWQAAAMLAAPLRLPVWLREGLGENDRSATGFLPPDEFQRVADAFFARPDESVRGWERASDAQQRIVTAVGAVIASADPARGDIAVVAHGGVGALLLCHVLGEAIDRQHDQPGGGGGNLFRFDAATGALRHGWRPSDAG